MLTWYLLIYPNYETNKFLKYKKIQKQKNNIDQWDK